MSECQERDIYNMSDLLKTFKIKRYYPYFTAETVEAQIDRIACRWWSC